VEFSSENIIQNNIVLRSIFYQNGDQGTVLIESNNNIIDNNTISNIEFAVDTYDSNNNQFSNNKFIDVVNGMFIQGNNNRITNNTFYNIDVEGTCGISVKNSFNNTISNNLAYYMGEWGIHLTNVSNCTISSNLIHDINTGIKVDNSECNNFSFNEIYRSGTGVGITGSKDELILNNTVYYNTGTGIDIQSSTRNTVFGNTVYQNGIYGIILFNSHSNNISRNSVFDNINEGLNLKASNGNIVTWNDFQENGGNQVIDDGANNIFVFNYWEGWDRPDNDSDGFVDDPFLIGVGNQDNYPVIGPITHVILLPNIISVQIEATYSDSWPIQWTPAIDSFGHHVFYSLFYSLDGGNSWVQLGSNLTETTYTWDTTTVSNGENYVLKLQVACSEGKTITSPLTSQFRIENLSPSAPSSPYDPVPNVVLLIIGVTIIIGSIIIYSLYVKFKPQESFVEFIQTAQIDFLRSLYHKVVIGLENIQVGVIPEPVSFPEVEVPSPAAMTTYFPSDIQNDLKSEIKGRTVLTLIEIAYQYPNETNPANLSRILDIPPSTLSSEIKRLKKLHYIEPDTSERVFRDARYRSYAITPKGASFLRILKGALEVSIVRIREKDIGYVRK
jgi:parallel beta-helix repeat protein